MFAQILKPQPPGLKKILSGNDGPGEFCKELLTDAVNRDDSPSIWIQCNEKVRLLG
jgi:hypothetical protein